MFNMLANTFLNFCYLTVFIVVNNCDAGQDKLKIDSGLKAEGNSDTTSENSLNAKLIVHLPDTTTQIHSGNVSIPLASANDEIKIASEGGDVTLTKGITASNPDTDDSNHSTGSKPRKGVGHPKSSVVARKGVNSTDELGAKELNASVSKSLEDQVPDNTTAVTNKTVVSSKGSHDAFNNRTFEIKKKIHEIHVKKPEVVSDKDVPDEFDKYAMIKTSTTGEDYVIIGIVIVIGIWFSVFGALIFYRRAGEYWDRRHYRRMDFLVEGMYND